MAHVAISEQADDDVTSIIAYLMREAGRTTAEKYARAFDAAYDRLAQFPRI